MTSSETVDPPWITAEEAARRAEVTPECIGRWVRRYQIGRKVAGRLRVDPNALARLLAGDEPTTSRGGPLPRREDAR